MAGDRSGLDHFFILIPDLAPGLEELRQVGFQPTKTGRHAAFGSVNNLCVFEDDYLEILSIEKIVPEGQTLRDSIAAFPGIHGIAFATHSARQDVARNAAAGIECMPAADYGRPVDLGDRFEEARFRSAPVSTGYIKGIYPFHCEHFTPDLVWRAEDQVHPNGVTGIRGLTAICHDPQATAARFAAICKPDSLSLEENGATGGAPRVRLGSYVFDFLRPDAFAAQYPHLGDDFGHLEADRDVKFALVSLSCQSLTDVETHLRVGATRSAEGSALITGMLPHLRCAFSFEE